MMSQAFFSKVKATCVVLVAAMIVAGCAVRPAREIFTLEEQLTARPAGLSDVRIYADQPAADLLRFARAGTTAQSQTMLALSGGAENGAFGAGFLVGWSETGKRPSFDVVTGVSTGALMAPFALLGPRYDGVLTTVYTQTAEADIIAAPSLSGVLFGEAYADSGPLRRMIERYADHALLQAIATETRHGRRLYVVTTNFDTQRAVIWDMGAIALAAERQPVRAVELFRSVLLASASIPGLLPPVMIDVETPGGRQFQELHVDGGTTTQILTVPESFITAGATGARVSSFSMFAIVNSRLQPEFDVVERRTPVIARRALSTVLKSYTRASLASASAFARENRLDFLVASINSAFAEPSSDDLFDTAYMRRLFVYGRARGMAAHFDPPLTPGGASIRRPASLVVSAAQTRPRDRTGAPR